MRCTCNFGLVYEPGCGFGHRDDSLCEACEREGDEFDLMATAEAFSRPPEDDDHDQIMEAA